MVEKLSFNDVSNFLVSQLNSGNGLDHHNLKKCWVAICIFFAQNRSFLLSAIGKNKSLLSVLYFLVRSTAME